MHTSLFDGTTVNIIIGFCILAFALIAIFTDSTPVKWISGLLAIFGLGLLYRRMFPSDAEIKRRYEENKALANTYYDDRKNALNTIKDNKEKIEALKTQKQTIDEADKTVQEQIAIVDTDIAKLEKQNQELEKSIDARQAKLDSFFSRKGEHAQPNTSIDTPATGTTTSAEASTSVAGIDDYRLKGDLE
ncbi:hypothetical protein TDB9533_02612 [Thalassocella blandensis]|nr:hypothetical protein TDB9533_02612 [Thalassocella blandensis]